MNVWTLLNYAAWIVSILLFGWMILDAIAVNKQYEEDFLMSSREGEE
ncbi:MAG: hypothetical protein ACKVQA_21315 [Burkholderiales bacterium]